jgi:hypothetical protein
MQDPEVPYVRKVLASRHSSCGGLPQVIGVPAHAPLVHVSSTVQGSTSLHEAPFLNS